MPDGVWPAAGPGDPVLPVPGLLCAPLRWPSCPAAATLGPADSVGVGLRWSKLCASDADRPGNAIHTPPMTSTTAAAAASSTTFRLDRAAGAFLPRSPSVGSPCLAAGPPGASGP